jgi:uncharacterized membrane protein
MSNKKPAILRKKYINFQKYYTLFCEYEGLIIIFFLANIIFKGFWSLIAAYPIIIFFFIVSKSYESHNSRIINQINWLSNELML